MTIPVYVACPFDSIVTPVPTATEEPADTLVAKVPTPAFTPVVWNCLNLLEEKPKSKASLVVG